MPLEVSRNSCVERVGSQVRLVRMPGVDLCFVPIDGKVRVDVFIHDGCEPGDLPTWVEKEYCGPWDIICSQQGSKHGVV
jgi:hypothetical protein